MFKVIITEHYGPFYGMGGYGSETLIGIDRSPKRAFAKARGRINGGHRRTTGENPATGICGGGVPILAELQVFRGSKRIKYDLS